MEMSEVQRAVAATKEIASTLNLGVSEATVVWNSNKLALRLLPCDVFARVAFVGQEVLIFEIEIARLLAESDSPIAGLEARVEPRVYERDEFAVTLWTYHEQSRQEISGADYATALEQLHAGMAQIDVRAPHFTDRVAQAQRLVASKERTPELEDADRELLDTTLRDSSQRISERSSAEQLLHGEPHPGNLLKTSSGLLFIDLETCCRGPVEFDLAHVPENVSECYSRADRELTRESRRLVLAMVAAWRFDPDDQFPNGEQARRTLLTALRTGPPWHTLDFVMNHADVP